MSDITTGYTFIDGEKGVTAQKENDQVNLAVINPAFVSAKPLTSVVDNADQLLILKAAGTYARAPFSTVSTSVAGQLALADATTNGMLKQVSGVATDVVDGTNNCRPIASVITQAARGYNSIGNPNFEVDQRNVGNGVNPGSTGTFICDRWVVQKVAATGTLSARQIASATSGQVVPGTNFRISSSFLSVQVGTAQASLGAGDFVIIQQYVEGPAWRELSNDVHSISLLVNCSIALSFVVGLRDPSGSRSLLKLVSVPANVWTLITLPNLPIFDPAGSFTQVPGANGYLFNIDLAVGSNYIGAPNSWQTGNLLGVSGMTNFLAAAGATFNLAFVQHEPGPVCTSLQDLDFVTNLSRCKRYYQKTNTYPNLFPTAGDVIQLGTLLNASTTVRTGLRFEVEMAKTPTLQFGGVAGALNQVYIDLVGDVPIASGGATTKGLGGITLASASAPGTGIAVLGQVTADTGW